MVVEETFVSLKKFKTVFLRRNFEIGRGAFTETLPTSKKKEIRNVNV
jgi:hypothetical protein